MSSAKVKLYGISNFFGDIIGSKPHTEKRFVKAAGDVYTVRYEEALALEAAYQRWKLSKIEQALSAKGITL